MRRTLFALLVLVLCFHFFALISPFQVFAYYTNMPAAIVIGQPSFTSSNRDQGGSTAANTLDNPTDTSLSNGKMAIADRGNRRVLIFNRIPTSANASADVVVGQADFTGSSSNQGGSAGANTLSLPNTVEISNGKLYIADNTNYRVLIYNSVPTSNNASADVVVGQPDFTSASTNQGGSAAANTLGSPTDMVVAEGKLIIVDSSNNRVLIYNQIPTTNNASADVVIGQQDFTSTSNNQGGSAAANTLRGPQRIAYANGKLIIGDNTNRRVLIFNSIPTSNNASADVVYGQSSFTSTSWSANTQSSILAPTLATDGKRLFMSDNQRVLIVNQIPTGNGASANLVLGQSTFTASTANQGGSTAANTFSTPSGLAFDNQQLAVADFGNHRVIIFSNQLPSTTFTNTLVSGIANGRQKLQGRATTNVVNARVVGVEYSVNGNDSWTGAFPTDGMFNEATEEYYFDFDPSSNNPDTTKNTGFTVKVRNTHGNPLDVSSSSLYFEPFVANSPADKTYTSSSLPSFSFSINSWRFSDLKENLDSFRVSINKDNQGWVPYIENIPVSYEKVRDTVDNLRRSVTVTEGNGVFEDARKIVAYTSNNGTLEVQAKAVNQQTGASSDKDWKNGGFLLPTGTYQWRIEALDRAGHVQATESRTLFLGSRQIITSRSWFPLTIDSFSGIGDHLDLSTIHPQDIQGSYTATSTQPIITGIATAGSTVTLSLTNKICVVREREHCTNSSVTTTGDNSRYLLVSPPLVEGNDYTAVLSVTDTGGNYNRLPEMTISVGE